MRHCPPCHAAWYSRFAFLLRDLEDLQWKEKNWVQSPLPMAGCTEHVTGAISLHDNNTTSILLFSQRSKWIRISHTLVYLRCTSYTTAMGGKDWFDVNIIGRNSVYEFELRRDYDVKKLEKNISKIAIVLDHSVPYFFWFLWIFMGAIKHKTG